jgi:hypothetical protein
MVHVVVAILVVVRSLIVQARDLVTGFHGMADHSACHAA